jgi:hypothetical protein
MRYVRFKFLKNISAKTEDIVKNRGMAEQNLSNSIYNAWD